MFFLLLMALLFLFMPRVAAVQADSEVASVELIIEPRTKETYGPAPLEGREAVLWWIHYWAVYYGYTDEKKAEAIVSCEGGFTDPHICNKQYGCTSGQGPAQFIPTTWAGLQKAIGVQDVFSIKDNIHGLIYLLQRDGDRHWRPYSGHCWVPKLGGGTQPL